MAAPRLSEVLAVLDAAYPQTLAEAWDAPGLSVGDPDESVDTVLFAVDATDAVVDQALALGAQLLVTHHPLLMRGVESVRADSPKGRLVHRLIRGGCALFSAHTNADAASPGVSDALAEAIGITVTGPLDPIAQDPIDKLVVFVPDESGRAVADSMFAAGAGQIGNYSMNSWRTEGIGQFKPEAGSHPAIGAVGELQHVQEMRIEVVFPRSKRDAVVAAMVAAHPYETPAFDVFEHAALPSERGIGRVGELPEPMTLAAFTEHVGAALPKTVWGVRAAGDPQQLVRRVAVSGGSGDSYLDAATRAGVDVFVTSDLRHHRADEHLRAGGPALIDTAHWASEWPWLNQAQALLDGAFGASGSWHSEVSTLRTDPWTLSAGAER